MEYVVRALTTVRVRVGTQLVVSLHRRNVTEDETWMTETCTTSSAIEMHMTGLKTVAKGETALNRNDTTRGTMIFVVPTLTTLTDNVSLKEDATKEESTLFPTT
jgi:hypothetical protein